MIESIANMGDNQVTEVPVINHEILEVKQQELVITGDLSVNNTQAVNISEKIRNFQSALDSSSVSSGSETTAGKSFETPGSSKTTATVGDIQSPGKLLKDGRVAKFKAQFDKSLNDSLSPTKKPNISPAQKHKGTPTSLSTNYHIQENKRSTTKSQTLGTSSNRNQGIKPSPLGVPYLHLSTQNNRIREIQKNTSNLGPRSASTGNLTNVGLSTSPSVIAGSPQTRRREVVVPGTNISAVRSTIKHPSPRLFRKDISGQGITSVKPGLQAVKTGNTVTKIVTSTPTHDDGNCEPSVKEGESFTKVETQLNVTIGSQTQAEALTVKQESVKSNKKVENKIPPLKPQKPVKPFNLSHRQVLADSSGRKDSPIPGRKISGGNNGTKISPASGLKPIPRFQTSKSSLKNLKLPRANSPRTVSPRSASPRTVSPKSSSPCSPSAGGKGRSRFFTPTSSSVLRGKEKSPARGKTKTTPGKDTNKKLHGHLQPSNWSNASDPNKVSSVDSPHHRNPKELDIQNRDPINMDKNLVLDKMHWDSQKNVDTIQMVNALVDSNSNIREDTVGVLTSVEDGNITSVNKREIVHKGTGEYKDVIMDIVNSPSIKPEEEQTNEVEKVSPGDHMVVANDKICAEQGEIGINSATQENVMTDNTGSASANLERDHGKDGVHTVINVPQDVNLLASALTLNAKLEQENAKMRDIYFKKLDVEKEHNYAQLAPDENREKHQDTESEVNSIEKVTDPLVDEIFLQCDRGEKVYNVVNERPSKIIVPRKKVIEGNQNSDVTAIDKNNVVKDYNITLGLDQLETAHPKGTETTHIGDCSQYTDINENESNKTTIVIQPKESAKPVATFPFAGVSAIITPKADENCNPVAFVTLKVADQTEYVESGNGTSLPKRHTYPSGLDYRMEQNKLYLGDGIENMTGDGSDSSHSLVHVKTWPDINILDSQGNMVNQDDVRGDGDKTLNLTDQGDLNTAQDTVNTLIMKDENCPDSEAKPSCNDEGMSVSNIDQGNTELISEPVMVTVSSSSDLEGNLSGTDDDADDYASIVDKVLWTDDMENVLDKNESEEEEEVSPSGLASSISMFLEAYEAQLKNQGKTTPPKGNSVSPTYIAGLSPVSHSSHHLRVPGNGSNSGERPLAIFRSRSNSKCNETIFEERESQSSGEEDIGSKESGLDTIPGLWRVPPGRIGSYDKISTNTESSAFQSETSEEDLTTSINLDDWWENWTMGRQRKSQKDEGDDDQDKSELDKLKVIISKMNLNSRRPSVSEWREKYLDKPTFLWNHAGGKPPVLSNSGSTKDLTSEESPVEEPPEWTDDRVNKINDAISWVRTELMAMKLEDEALARRLISLKTDLRDLRLQGASRAHRELIEDAIAAEHDVIHDVADSPLDSHIDATLRHCGVTKMNISTRRFSVF